MHFYVGLALHHYGQPAQALVHLQKATQGVPWSILVHCKLADTLSELGRDAEALAVRRRITQLEPRELLDYPCLIGTFKVFGEEDQAAATWGAFVRAFPNDPDANRGALWSHVANATRAKTELMSRDPNSPYLLRLLGWVGIERGEYPYALAMFRRALELEPDVRAVHEALALVYEKAGRPEWAHIERARAAALPELDCGGSDSPACNFAAGRFELAPAIEPAATQSDLFWAVRSYETLAKQALERLKLLPDTVENLTVLVGVTVKLRRYADAEEACRRAQQLGVESEEVERNCAEALFHTNRVEEVRPLLTRFYRSDPNDPRWGAMLGNLLTEEQEFDRAIPLLEASLEASLALQYPPHSVRVDLGRSYLALGQAAKALPHLQAAAAFDTDGSTHHLLAQALQRLGMTTQAHAALVKYEALVSVKELKSTAAATEITPPH